jgi:hypothetical protein
MIMKKSCLIEQHNDAPDRAHIIFYSTHPFPEKSSDTVTEGPLSEKLDNEIPDIEVKGSGEHGLLFVTPSPHKNGHNYEIIGTRELENIATDAFETHIDNICNKFGIPYLNGNGNGSNNAKQPINELFNEDTKIYEGHNRHEALLRVMGSLLRRNHNILSEAEIKPLADIWNQKHCIPPLDEKEFEKQWNDAVKFITKQIVNARINQGEETETETDGERCERRFREDLEGNVYCRINPDIERFIVAQKKTRRLVEMKAMEQEIKSEKGDSYKLNYLQQVKIYLTCIPTRIVRHKRTFYFMPDEQKFTISFVDSSGEKFSLTHKALSEIMSGLRDRGYVINDGSEYALNTMVQAFKETKTIQDTEDMNIVGFFTDKDFNGNDKAREIIASNIEITEPNISELASALDLLEELKPYYEHKSGGEALLATTIVWAIFAPMNFMLKEGAYFLNWILYHGSANATKTTSGVIALAVDAHHNDPKFNLGYGNINTEARLGETICKTTLCTVMGQLVKYCQL